MKPIKFILLASGLSIIALTFLATYINVGEGITFTLWNLHSPELGSLVHPYVILVAGGVPALFGAIALGRNSLPRWQSIVSVVCATIGLFMAWAVFSKTQTHFGDNGGVGAKLIVGALLAALAASIAGIVKPERT
jgi:hypothetical protein